MTRDEETLLLRFLQEADAPLLARHLRLRERVALKKGERLLFDVTYGSETGYLHIDADLTSGELLAAEMNVGFPTLIGLNRSPLELRILCEHVLDLLDEVLAALSEGTPA